VQRVLRRCRAGHAYLCMRVRSNRRSQSLSRILAHSHQSRAQLRARRNHLWRGGSGRPATIAGSSTTGNRRQKWNVTSRYARNSETPGCSSSRNGRPRAALAAAHVAQHVSLTATGWLRGGGATKVGAIDGDKGNCFQRLAIASNSATVA
jgi:hypothetical protein